MYRMTAARSWAKAGETFAIFLDMKTRTYLTAAALATAAALSSAAAVPAASAHVTTPAHPDIQVWQSLTTTIHPITKKGVIAGTWCLSAPDFGEEFRTHNAAPVLLLPCVVGAADQTWDAQITGDVLDVSLAVDSDYRMGIASMLVGGAYGVDLVPLFRTLGEPAVILFRKNGAAMIRIPKIEGRLLTVPAEANGRATWALPGARYKNQWFFFDKGWELK
jgi:hypothetical protein